MIKVEVLEEFTLQKFNQLKNIVRKGKEEKGRLFKGDTFECKEDMADYLTGNNPVHRVVVKVLEVISEKAVKKVANPSNEYVFLISWSSPLSGIPKSFRKAALSVSLNTYMFLPNMLISIDTGSEYGPTSAVFLPLIL